MIAKSDLVILVLSASALAVGVYRWQVNTSTVPAVAVAAQSRTKAQAAVQPAPRALASSERDEGNPGNAAPTVRRIARADDPERPSVATAPAASVGSEPGAIAASDAAPDPNEAGGPLYGTYEVKSGDFLGLIAERFGTSVATLREINDISGSTIQIGQSIRYPQPAN